MRIGVYAHTHGSNHGIEAFVKGAGKLGHAVIRRNPAPFTPDQVENFDLICIWGSRKQKFKTVIDAYNAKGIPSLVLEMAFFERDKRVSIGINSQYWIPSIDVKADRWNELQIPIKPYTFNRDGYILVCSQDQNDSWEKEIVPIIKSITNREIVVRRHPSFTEPEDRVPLQHHFDGAYCVVCDTSNVANEALVSGVPVICSKNAMFASICITDINKIESFSINALPSREKYFHKLAYAQWTYDELQSGLAVAWYTSLIDRKPFEHKITKSKVSIITCTGDRAQSFENCIDFVARQTITPDEWVIVDDGDMPTVTVEMCQRSGIKDVKVIRRNKKSNDPIHTLSVNMLVGLKQITGDKIVIIEDDDWYDKDHVRKMINALDSADLCGIQGIHYWNIKHQCFAKVGSTVKHSSLCQTAFCKNVTQTILSICEKGEVRVNTLGLIDMSLWESWKGSKYLLQYSDSVIGIKGVPGRLGLTSGHTNFKSYQKDENLSLLANKIGHDVRRYL